MSRFERKKRGVECLKLKQQGRISFGDLADNAIKELFYVTDEEYDLICDKTTDEELDCIVDIVSFVEVSISDIKRALTIIDKIINS